MNRSLTSNNPRWAAAEAKFIREIDQGHAVAEAAKVAGISETTGYRWANRLALKGANGHANGSADDTRTPEERAKAMRDKAACLRVEAMELDMQADKLLHDALNDLTQRADAIRSTLGGKSDVRDFPLPPGPSLNEFAENPVPSN